MLKNATHLISQHPLIEAVAVSDTFCTELAYVERVGPCLRLVFAVEQSIIDSNSAERIVMAKIVLPADATLLVLAQLSGQPKTIGKYHETTDEQGRPN